MKKLWVRINSWDRDLVINAIEGGAGGIVLPRGCCKLISELGKITTIAKDGDLILGLDVIFFRLKNVEDEHKVVKLSKNKIVILECTNWTIIPLENIIAKGNGDNIILQVKNLRDAQVAFGVLERGVGGVLFCADYFPNLKKTLLEISKVDKCFDLKTALIESVTYVGMGDRVCVDTCTSMFPGKGMLVGNISNFLFLMHAESLKNNYVKRRPFRINAGAVHAYTKIADNKTCYLSELVAGDVVQIVNYSGCTEMAVVGRIKIEKRPLLLIKAIFEDRVGTIIVQNAETIRLISHKGVAISVSKLKPGDEVLVSVESIGRHFGNEIQEYIEEK